MTVGQTIADANWLLSAIMQSGAAMVAIVAGLLGSRYVSLHAEQLAARRRVDDAQRRWERTKESLGRAEGELEKYWVEDALADRRVYREIVSQNFTPTLDQIRDVIPAVEHELPSPVLQEQVQQLAEELQLAVERLRDIVPPEEKDHPSFDDVRRRHRLRVRNAAAWQWVYRQLVDRSEKAARDKERRARGPYGADYSALLAASTFERPEVVAIRGLATVQEKAGYEARLIGYRDEELRSHQAAEAELELARTSFQEARQPEGFRLALEVLTYLAVVSIVVPGLLMANGAVVWPSWVRAVVVGAFLSGVGLLLRFLFVYAGYLSEQSSRTTLPRGVARLLWRE